MFRLSFPDIVTPLPFPCPGVNYYFECCVHLFPIRLHNFIRHILQNNIFHVISQGPSRKVRRGYKETICRSVIECREPERISTVLELVALEFHHHLYILRAKKRYSKKVRCEKGTWQAPRLSVKVGFSPPNFTGKLGKNLSSFCFEEVEIQQRKGIQKFLDSVGENNLFLYIIISILLWT